MKNNIFITIVGTNFYYGMKPFEVNRLIKLTKEPDNLYDEEAIRAELPYIDKIGYVANSSHTVAKGTYSAGRIYDFFEDYTYAQVLFVTKSEVICLVLDKEDVEKDSSKIGEVKDTNTNDGFKINEKKPIGFNG